MSATAGRVAGVVLAAGASTRLGEPKQLVQIGGERLLERAVRVCRDAGCVPVVVVLGAHADEIVAQCKLEGAEVLRCPQWEQGMSRSLAAGFGAAMQANVVGAIVMTADMPFVTGQHLQALSGERNRLQASGYAGRRGVPAYFPREYFAPLMKLQGDAGAREHLQEATLVELGANALDVDTPDALQEARARAAASA